MSATAVQSIAHASVKDGLTHHEVLKLASLGNWGAVQGNIHRELMKFVKTQNLPDAVIIRAPCIDTNNEETTVRFEDTAVMCPHLWISALSKNEVGSALLSLDSLNEFWSQVPADDPRLVGHPVLQESKYQETFVPLWVHADGVEYATSDSLMTWTCGCVLSTTNSMDSMFLMAAFVKSVTAVRATHGHDTWEEIWRVLRWSLLALWEGTHPLTDWNNKRLDAGSYLGSLQGQPLVAGGFRFYVWNILGDLEMYANVLKLPHWNSHRFCWQCDCSRVDVGKDWTQNWGQTGWAVHDPALYKFPSPHAIFTLPGVTSWCVCFDMLHCMDNHGICSNLAGSVLHWLVFEDIRHLTVKAALIASQQKLAELWHRLRAIYDELGITERFSKIFMSMLCNPAKPHSTWATLKGKGGETRHFIPVLMQLVKEQLQQKKNCQVRKHMFLALQAACNVYSTCDSQGMFMAAPASRFCLSSMEALLKNYSWFHHHTLDQDMYYCNIVPKCHFSWHMAYFSKYCNPRHVWTYKCESWVGKVSTIAASCAHGTRSSALTVSLAKKYIVMVSVNLWRVVHDD